MEVWCRRRRGGGEITLPFVKLCYTFEEKIFFSVTIIFEGWVVGLGQEGLRDGREAV